MHTVQALLMSMRGKSQRGLLQTLQARSVSQLFQVPSVGVGNSTTTYVENCTVTCPPVDK